MKTLVPAILVGVYMIGLADSGCAQTAENSMGKQILEGMESSFSLPARNWLKPREDGKKEYPLRGFSITPSFNYPLSRINVAGKQGLGSQGQQQAATPTINVSVKYSPITYWFVQTTFYAYLAPNKQQPWNPDFSYTFGYEDYHPYTFSLVYSNYGGNRFRPNKALHEQFSLFSQGTVSLGWKFQLPEKLEDQLKLTDQSTMGWSVAYNVTPRYLDARTLTTKGPKQTLTLSYNNTFYKKFYWNVTVYGYLHSSQEQPWNPDFTYGFGYADYRPGKFSVQYNNYSGNRFPWRKQSPGTGNLSNGGISVSWNWAWPQ
jgi:hypothetical protein